MLWLRYPHSLYSSFFFAEEEMPSEDGPGWKKGASGNVFVLWVSRSLQGQGDKRNRQVPNPLTWRKEGVKQPMGDDVVRVGGVWEDVSSIVYPSYRRLGVVATIRGTALESSHEGQNWW